MVAASLVIPAFNEADNIDPFMKRVKDIFNPEEYDLECIFIDDGSSDDTYSRIKKAVAEYTEYKVKGIRFSRNFGKESAILAGLEHSNGDYISIIDADLQQDPKYVLQMIDILENDEEYDAVACYQASRREGALQKVFKKGFYRIANRISEVGFEENASDFRTMRRSVAEAIVNMPEYNRFSKGLFSWVGYNTFYMPYDVAERIHGTTKWNIRKLFRYAVDGFVGFSSTPLRAASWCGAFLAFIAFVYLIAVVVKRAMYGVEVPGYATIVSLILIIGGMQMIFIGIIGEYIARMFMEVKNRPNYIVKDIISNTDVETES